MSSAGAARQTSSQSIPGLSSHSHFPHSDAQMPAPDHSPSNFTPLTAEGSSKTHNSHIHHSPNLTSTSSYVTNRIASVQGQSAFVPRFNPSAAGLSTCTNLTRPLTMQETENLRHLDKLKQFLADAPLWSTASSTNQNNLFPNSADHFHPDMNRFPLRPSEYVSCVFWNNRYYITGTDIVRALVFRFEAFGRPVTNFKKFEEGIFSDLRNLKPGDDASLEEPKSPFLDFLFKYQCIRTQKKQKVFNWFSVPHDRLFLDALERDLKRENTGLESTTVIFGEPALSFTYESQRSLYEQFSKTQNVIEADGRNTDLLQMNRKNNTPGSALTVPHGAAVHNSNSRQLHPHDPHIDGGGFPLAPHDPNRTYITHPVFDGTPTYKQRRKRSTNRADAATRSSSEESNQTHVSALDFGVGYDRGDPCMTAADMFVYQIRGQQNASVRSVKAMPPARGDAIWPSASQLTLGQSSVQNASMSNSWQPSEERAPQNDLPAFMEDSSLAAFHSDVNGYSNTGKESTTKVFLCPLLSCGRMFKRMEHLKRHGRTHTMERPYSCLRCGKCFSRSDNLNQHLRIHTRAEGADTPSGELVAFDTEMENEEGDAPFFAGRSFTECSLKKYEVELQGQVKDVQGDEEGLVEVPGVVHGINTTTSDPDLVEAYFSQTATVNHSIHLESSEMDPQWAFVDSPLATAACDGEPMMGSLTGPSHSQDFTVETMSPHRSEVGPHRRHRSSTPSLMSSHSASSNGSRSYHPYSRTSSSHSSPAALMHSLDTPSYTMSSDVFRFTQPRSFSTPSSSQGMLDIGDLNLDHIFTNTMSYFAEPDNPEFSQQYPDPSFEVRQSI